LTIKKYGGNYPEATKDLYRMGVLKQYPTQKQIVFFRDHGINITYRFKGLSPEKFGKISKLLLEAAYKEAERYLDYKYRFARFEVRLNRTTKGRKSLPLEQTYQASKHPESYIMVYGPGYETGEAIFLIDQVEKILDIPARYQGRVKRQRPYLVTSLQVCVRAGDLPIQLSEKKEVTKKETIKEEIIKEESV